VLADAVLEALLDAQMKLQSIPRLVQHRVTPAALILSLTPADVTTIHVDDAGGVHAPSEDVILDGLAEAREERVVLVANDAHVATVVGTQEADRAHRAFVDLFTHLATVLDPHQHHRAAVLTRPPMRTSQRPRSSET